MLMRGLCILCPQNLIALSCSFVMRDTFCANFFSYRLNYQAQNILGRTRCKEVLGKLA